MCNFGDSEADRVVDFFILHGEIHIYHVYLYRYTFQDNQQSKSRTGFAAQEWLWSFY